MAHPLPDPAALVARAGWLRARLAAVPGIAWRTDYLRSRAAHEAALESLAAELRALPDQPKIGPSGNGATIAMLGIRCTSAAGLHGALTNWLARVGS